METGGGGGDPMGVNPGVSGGHQSDGIVSDVRVAAASILQDYGWVLLCVSVLTYFAYNRLANSFSSSSRSSSAANHSASPLDAQTILERQEKMAAARAKMQAELDMQVEQEKIKQREREEQMRDNKIQQWENLQTGKGYYSRTKDTTKETTASPSSSTQESSGQKKTTSSGAKKAAKKDYNPLMGDSFGGSCSWRPGSRRMGGGG